MLRSERVFFIAVIVYALGLWLAGESLADSTGCPDGHACTWDHSSYQGTRAEYGHGFYTGSWYPLWSNQRSAKNRLGGGWLLQIADGPPGNRTWLDALCPGGNRSDPGPFDYVRVIEGFCQ